MKNKRLILEITLFTFIALIALGYENCTGSSGVVFGTKTQNTTITGNPLTPVSNQLVQAVCGVLTRCNQQVTLNKCGEGALAAHGMALPLGLQPQNYDTLATITQAEASGTLIGSPVAATSCAASITALGCSDARVVSAYDPAAANPFAGIATLVSGQTCAGILTTPVQYACSSTAFVRGATNPVVTPVTPASGGVITVSPPLPSGLSLDSSSGKISGTPTTVTPATTYSVSVSGVAAATQIQLTTGDGYVVNDLGDATDQMPGDHICATSAGQCTLRAALEEANADGAGTYTIILPSGTIALGSPLPIRTNVNLYGGCSGSTVIDGQAHGNVFQVLAAGLSVFMQSLTLQNGLANEGGGISGGFNSNLKFTGQQMKFIHNTATSTSWGGGAVAWGGGASSFNCTECIFDGNQASGNEGGALYLAGPSISVQKSLFINNSAVFGGALFSSSGGDSYINCTFYGNSASANGGAAFMNATGTTFINDTFVNNTSPGTFGAGALYFASTASGKLANNLFANNTGAVGTCDGSITSMGGNLVWPSLSTCSFNQPTDLSVSPTLGPLQNYGGFSNTLALLQGSPGIDGGVTSQCPATDQRNAPRPANSGCDIGAFEAQ